LVCSGDKKLSQSGDIPKSTQVVAKGVPHSRQRPYDLTFPGAGKLLVSCGFGLNWAASVMWQGAFDNNIILVRPLNALREFFLRYYLIT